MESLRHTARYSAVIWVSEARASIRAEVVKIDMKPFPWRPLAGFSVRVGVERADLGLARDRGWQGQNVTSQEGESCTVRCFGIRHGDLLCGNRIAKK